MGQKNEKNLTIADIAEALGVSKTTVSRAISGKGRIGAETKARVNEYIKEHNYKPNIIAKSLAKSKTYNIGMVLPGELEEMDMPFFQNCLLGVTEIAGTIGYDVIVSNVTAKNQSALERLVENQKVDGVILSRTLVDDTAVKYLKKAGMPFVTIGSTFEKNVIQVDSNNEEACKELTNQLLMRGIRKTGVIGGSMQHVVTRSRMAGYQMAYEEFGLVIDRSMVYLEVENTVMVERIVEELLSKQVECIICMDDRFCNHVLNKLRREHVKVPDDVQIASFYYSAMLESSMTPITSIRFDIKELGMVTCKTLLDVIEGKDVPERTYLGYQVTLRESTKRLIG